VFSPEGTVTVCERTSMNDKDERMAVGGTWNGIRPANRRRGALYLYVGAWNGIAGSGLGTCRLYHPVYSITAMR